MTAREIAKEIGISYEACRKRIRRLGIEPQKTYGTTHVYSPDVVDQLRRKEHL